MKPYRKPVYLLSDNRPLFDKGFMNRVMSEIESKTPRAAHIGIFNGDQPQFFRLFYESLELFAFSRISHITSSIAGAIQFGINKKKKMRVDFINIFQLSMQFCFY